MYTTACVTGGKVDRGIELLEEFCESRRGVATDNVSQYCFLVNLFCRRLFIAGELKKAEPYLREVLKLREQIEPEKYTTAATRALLGCALCVQKKHAEAEPLLLEGYEILKLNIEKMSQQDLPLLVQTADQLVQLYKATGDESNAAKWTAEKSTYIKTKDKKQQAATHIQTIAIRLS